MSKLCENCGRVVSYDPYFKAYVCRQCGSQISIKKTWERYEGKRVIRIPAGQHEGLSDAKQMA